MYKHTLHGRVAAPKSVLPVAGRLYADNVQYLPTARKRSASAVQDYARRVWDLSISLTLLTPCVPMMLLIMLAIVIEGKTSIFSVQKHIGRDGKIFRLFSFRTLLPVHPDATPVYTVVGRFLQRTALVNLPALWNVVRGDMSIVGPRVIPMYLKDHFSAQIRHYNLRHQAKPGLLGMASVARTRGGLDDIDAMHREVDFDVYYAHHQSLWLDIKILARFFWKRSGI